jgi:hypothetical protein
MLIIVRTSAQAEDHDPIAPEQLVGEAAETPGVLTQGTVRSQQLVAVTPDFAVMLPQYGLCVSNRESSAYSPAQ